ncbi:MAG: oxidoreductase [Pseudomonadota bacterium]|jgi:predicted DsbA family dithiol-disulfide isomerase
MKPLRVDIWSDIACPWCYVGKRRFEQALAQFAGRDSVQLHWHSFELDPSAPARVPEARQAERLAKKYGMTLQVAEQRMAHLSQLAEVEGIRFDFDQLKPGNTFDAHRVLHLAEARGKQDSLKERFLRGYLCEGQAIGEREVVARLACEVGLDADEVEATLAGNDYADEVRADQAQAAALGIHGVPFFVIGERYGISGAQPTELLAQALRKVQEELAAAAPEFVEGAACGPDGC